MVVFGSDVNYRAVEVNDSSRRVAINFIYQAQDFKVIKVKKD